MKIGIMGRTRMLLDTARLMKARGHEIAFVWTCRTEGYYGVAEADFEDLAADLGCPYLCTLNLADNAHKIADLGAEVCLSVNWITLIPAQFRDLFRYGVLNAHAGDLPRYRGNACPNWAILNGEQRVGLTIHQMADVLDAGPYLVKAFYPLTHNTYIGQVYQWMEETVPNLFAEGLEVMQSKGFTPQDPTVRPLRTFPRRPEDARIDWRAKTADIFALIRASSHPFDGAFCTLEGDPNEKIVVFAAQPHVSEDDFMAMPGQVCFAVEGDPVIATGDGLLRLTDCRLNGQDAASSKKRITQSLRHRLS